MNEILEFLKEAGYFFISTCDGDQPHVRAFGFKMIYEGKLYFCSGKHKPFFAQITKNPKVEVCAVKPNREWIRISGTVVLDDRIEPKAAAMEISPNLKNMYGGPDNQNFTVFYLKDVSAFLCSHTTEPRPVELCPCGED
jgi:uncharacterized pyridoxamine 5'-phosphate oxidase family protein